MKIRVGVIDDEQYSVESLVLHINKLFPDFEIAIKCTRPTEALEFLKTNTIDLLFLDVEIPRMNGFVVLVQCEVLPFDVIFITAYSQYALQAFKANAINYLLKPIDEQELQEVVEGWLAAKKSL